MSRTIEEAFTATQLPLPTIPGRWTKQLEEREHWLFCTNEPPAVPIYQIDNFVDAVIERESLIGLIIGYHDYGTNHWALHYYLIEEDFALLLQMPWGNADDDPAECLQHIQDMMKLLDETLQEIQRVRAAKLILPGRLIVVQSRWQTSRWGWWPLVRSASDEHDPDILADDWIWYFNNDALASALAELKKR